MIMFNCLLLFLFSGLTGCSHVSDENDEEQAVIEATVREMPKHHVLRDNEDTEILLCPDAGPLPSQPRVKASFFKKHVPSSITVHSFIERNKISHRLTPPLDLGRRFLLLSIAEHHRLIHDDLASERFYSQHPKASIGYLAFSRVGFNRERTEALLAFDYYCPLCSRCSTVMLKKKFGRWFWMEEDVRIVS